MPRLARYGAAIMFSSRANRHMVMFLFAVFLAVFATDALAFDQTTTASTTSAPTDSQSTSTAKTPAEFYKAWVLVPPLVTIVLAIWLRQVIPALAIGVLIASYMLEWYNTPYQYAEVALGGLTTAVEGFLIGALADVDHIKIIVFTLFIGGMVGIVAANGGTAAIVNTVARWASNRQRGQIVTWFAGLLVFFDDYANAMIVGPSMRPVCDRLKISRAKLAYIVDSTAAPVSSIALISTWVGAEIGYIAKGLEQLQQPPAFLTDMTAYRAFFYSIPYRFYAILALVMVFLIGWLNRDFGPMRKAENRSQNAIQQHDPIKDAIGGNGHAWYALVPILMLVFVTLALLLITGWPAAGLASIRTDAETPRWLGLFAVILDNCDSYNSILYGSLAALLAATFISLTTRALSLAKTMDAAVAGMSRMFTTMIVLVLAWALSTAMGKDALQLGYVAEALLRQANFDATWLPLVVFLTACVVSFATGTSWGTMGILCPAVVTISAGLLADLPAADALPLFYASVGAVLAGAVFGDHCSPISDTTVLSSLASECSLESHVWTQMPYALTVAIVSILCGDVLCRVYDQPWWVGLLIGSAMLLIVLLLIGRRPVPAPPPAAATSDEKSAP